MASSKALFLICLNLVFFTLVTSSYVPTPTTPTTPSPPPPTPSPPPPTPSYTPSPPPPTPSPPPPTASYTPTTPSSPPPSSPPPTPTTPTTPSSPPPPTPSTGGKCPKDTLKIGACIDVLKLGLVHVGPSRANACCSLIDGLAGIDAGLCLCTRLQVKLLGLIHLNIPLNVQLLLNFCEKAGDLKNYKCSNH